MARKAGLAIVAPTTGELAVDVRGHSRRLDKNDDDHARIYRSIDAMKNRLPVWGSLLVAALAALASALITAGVSG